MVVIIISIPLVIVNMIILTDLKYKSNISLKELLLSEIEKQNMEIQETKRIIDSTHLNKLLMNECIDIKSLIGKLGNDSLIKIKEEAIENIINDIN